MMTQHLPRTLARLASALALVGLMATTAAADGIVAHPDQLKFPPSNYQPPRAADHRVTLSNGMVAYLVPDHTTPHALRLEGYVSSTKPLSYQGSLIDEIQVRFEGGRIVESKASRGADVLAKVLDTDEGARRLGEVALVPHSSPISKSGIPAVTRSPAFTSTFVR